MDPRLHGDDGLALNSTRHSPFADSFTRSFAGMTPRNAAGIAAVTFSASPPPMRACYDAAMLFRAKHRWLIILRHIAGTDA